MKKTIIIIILIVLTLIPVRIDIKDGGSVSYEALLYGVTIYNQRILGPLRGTEVRILWFCAYDGSYYIYEPRVDFVDVDMTGVSEIEHKASKSELEIGNQIVEKGNKVFDFCGTLKEAS